MNKQKENIVNQIAFVLFCMYAVECAIGCSGHWLEFGGVSIRMILFTLCFVFSLPAAFNLTDCYLKKTPVILAGCFLLCLFFSAYIGFQNNNHVGFIVSDVTSFLAFLLLPGAYAVINTREKLDSLLSAILFSSFLLAQVTVFFHIAMPFLSGQIIQRINDWINWHSLGGFTLLSSGVRRIYFRSQIFLQFSAMICLWRMWRSTGWKRIFYCICEGTIVFAIILSYTRGFWLGFAVSLLLLLIMFIKDFRRLLIAAGACLAVIAVLSGISCIVYEGPHVYTEVISRIVSARESDDVSGYYLQEEQDDPNLNAIILRANSKKALKEKIRTYPIKGSGLGANLDGIRTDGKAEYMYLDTLMKLGLFGFAAYLAVFFFWPIRYLTYKWLPPEKKRSEVILGSEENECDMIVAGYIGVAVTSFVNPYLNNPMGIMMLTITCLAIELFGLMNQREKI